MYPNLYAEMARRRITQADLARYLDISKNAVSKRMLGHTEWKWPEVIKVQKMLGQELTPDYLFDTKSHNQPTKD